MYCNIIISQKPVKLKAVKYNKKHSKYCAFAVKAEDNLKGIEPLIKQGIKVLTAINKKKHRV